MLLFPRSTVSAFVAAVVLLLLDSSAISTAAEMQCQADGTCTPNKIECGVYMAPSTLGESTSMGIYTGKPLREEEVVNFPEIAIPLLFREFGDHVEGIEDGVLWDRYVWEGYVMEIDPYSDTNRDDSKAIFVPGVGCTVNSVLDMSNIESTHGSIYDTESLHRSKDPGAGGFTPYKNATTISNENLPAGAELFASYGDYWIVDIPEAQIALDAQLDLAELFLRRYHGTLNNKKQLTPALKQSLWEFTTTFPIYNQAMTNLPKSVSWKEVEDAIANHPKDFSVVREFIRKQSIRDLDWLDEWGYCQDHLYPDTSTLAQAGRGAFAYRDLPKDTVVGYAPLVHIGLHGNQVFHVKVEGAYPHEKPDLILNYSFGHPNSTVLLTPYGGIVNYINHNQKEANVRVRWPDRTLIAHLPEYLDRTPEELADTIDKIGLSFEYVATRDIAAGEEVFLDYGPAWEAAWNEHVKNWKPVENAERYVHSADWKEETFRTKAELESNPYPPNLITMCVESYSYDPDTEKYHWVEVLRELPYRLYCDVLDRIGEGEDALYVVRLKLKGGGYIDVRDVVPSGIFLYDKAFSQDWLLPNAFRHQIDMPTDILPKAWINK